MLQNVPRPVVEFSSQMVLELAAKIQEPADILARYGLSVEEFAVLRENPAFRAAYKEAKQFWESDSNVRERIATKAATMLEDALLDLHEIMTDRKMAVGSRLEAFKQIAVLAKVNGGEQAAKAGGAGGSINIHIDMGAQSVRVEKQAEAIDGEYHVAGISGADDLYGGGEDD
jgi:hypothetical protein